MTGTFAKLMPPWSPPGPARAMLHLRPWACRPQKLQPLACTARTRRTQAPAAPPRELWSAARPG
eukprot:9270634-Lingulodinium_polyedra.AAC.1